jgi:hypothetical protein
MTDNRNIRTVTHNDCPTGKSAWSSRRLAKRANHQIRNQHMRPFRCPQCRMYHLGHLPFAVMRGRLTADEYYGQRRIVPRGML